MNKWFAIDYLATKIAILFVIAMEGEVKNIKKNAGSILDDPCLSHVLIMIKKWCSGGVSGLFS